MIPSALSVEEHFEWMLCYLELIHWMAVPVANLGDIPQFRKYAEFGANTIRFADHVRAHALAARAVVPPDVLLQEAPWV
jgi:hypothetical protein